MRDEDGWLARPVNALFAKAPPPCSRRASGLVSTLVRPLSFSRFSQPGTCRAVRKTFGEEKTSGGDEMKEATVQSRSHRPDTYRVVSLSLFLLFGSLFGCVSASACLSRFISFAPLLFMSQFDIGPNKQEEGIEEEVGGEGI